MKSQIAIVFAIVGLLTAAFAMPVLAAPSFVYHVDDDGANDEPGQKDLTAQSAATDSVAPNHFYTSWKWDELSFSGKNTGDGCSLFDTDNDTPLRFVNYALCATVGDGQGPASATLLTVSLYRCTADNRVDRCAGPELVFTAAGAGAATYCSVADGTGSFPVGNPDTDTVIQCDITAIGAAATPPITVIGAGTLVNTCSYPSREPNSDPSDCVIRIPATNTSLGTTPSGTPTWSVTLQDSATVTPAAAGSVVFKLYNAAGCARCRPRLDQSRHRDQCHDRRGDHHPDRSQRRLDGRHLLLDRSLHTDRLGGLQRFHVALW